MSIAVTCPKCGKRYQIDEKFAGRRVQCRGCGAAMVVPAPAPELSAGPDAWAGIEHDRVPAASSTPAASRPTASGPLRSQGQPRPEDVYLTLPGEALIDSILPWATVGIFMLFLAMVGYPGYANISEQAAFFHASDQAKAREYGFLFGYLAGVVTIVAGVLAPLCLLGVFIASRIMTFANRPTLYWKCLGVVCTPLALSFAYNRFDLSESLASVSLWISIPATLAVLWLVTRLRPAPFGVAAGFVLVFCVGIPALLLSALDGVGRSPARSLAASSHGPGAMSSPRDRPSAMLSRVPTMAAPPPRAVRPRDTPERHAVEQQLRQIGQAIFIYQNLHHGDSPARLTELIAPDLLRAEDVSGSRGYGTPLGYQNPGHIRPEAGRFLPADLILVWEEVPHDGLRSAVFGDGHADTFDETEWRAAQEASARVRSQRAGPPVAAAASPAAPAAPATSPAGRSGVEAQVTRVGAALKAYAAAHGGTYPTSLDALTASGSLNASDAVPVGGVRWAYHPRGQSDPLPARFILVYDTGRADDKHTCFFGDGSVKTIGMEDWAYYLRDSNEAWRKSKAR